MKRILRKYNSVIYGNYKKKSLRYGLALGVALCLFALLKYLLNYLPSSPVTMSDNIALLLFTVVIVYLYRAGLPQGKMTLKEGFLIGFYSAVIGAVIYGMFMYSYSAAIDTQMPLRCGQTLSKIPEYAEYTPQQFAAMTKPSAIALQSIIYNVIMAVLWSLLVAVFLRTEKAETVNKNNKLK